MNNGNDLELMVLIKTTDDVRGKHLRPASWTTECQSAARIYAQEGAMANIRHLDEVHAVSGCSGYASWSNAQLFPS